MNQNNGGRNAAYIATPEVVADPSWLADSGASNHITSDLANLQVHSDYQGKDSLTVGNISKLQIENIGQNLYYTNGSIVALHNVLHVPKIQRNLLSISQLTCDNDCDVIFYSNCCYVKDKATGKVVLQGRLKDGLYQLNLNLSKSNKPCSVRAYEAQLSKSESTFSPVNYSYFSAI